MHSGKPNIAVTSFIQSSQGFSIHKQLSLTLHYLNSPHHLLMFSVHKLYDYVTLSHASTCWSPWKWSQIHHIGDGKNAQTFRDSFLQLWQAHLSLPPCSCSLTSCFLILIYFIMNVPDTLLLTLHLCSPGRHMSLLSLVWLTLHIRKMSPKHSKPHLSNPTISNTLDSSTADKGWPADKETKSLWHQGPNPLQFPMLITVNTDSLI